MFSVNYRVPILIILTGITVFFGFGLTKMTRENGIEALLPTDDEDYLFFKSMEEEFGATDQIVLGLTFPDSVYTAENLNLVRDLSLFLEEEDDIEGDDVLSLTTIENIDGINQELFIEPIIPDDEAITAEIVLSARDKVRDNDMLRGKIVSGDERSTALIVTVDSDISMNAERLAVVINRISRRIEQIKEARPEVEIYRSGMVSVKHTTSEYMARDMKTMFPIAIVVVMLILLVLLKSFSGIIMPMAVTLFSVVWTMGLKGWLGSPLTMTETVIPIMLIAIGCADGVHMISEFLAFRRSGIKAEEALTKTMKNLKTPVILTSITTTLGFLSLLMAPGVSVKNMGIFLGFGVLTAMLFSLLFIPALLSFAGDRKTVKEKRRKNLDLTGLGELLIKRKVPVIVLSLVFLGVSILSMMNIVVETDQIIFLRDSDPLKIATEKLQENLGGVNTVDIILSGPEDTFKEPDTLRFMDDLQAYADQHPSVGYTLSLADYIKKIYYEFNDKDQAFNRLPGETEIIDSETIPGQAIVSNLLFLYEMGGGDKLEKVVNGDYSLAKVSVRLLDTSQIGIEELVDDLEYWIGENKPENLTYRFSNDYIRLVMGDLVTESQIRSFVSTLAAIILLLMIIFKSPLSGILTALPVIIAVCFNFAVMWMTGTTLNIGTSIIASVGMGVGIDYAIHYFQRYKIHYAKTGNNSRAIIAALNESARPIMSNALAVGLGFLTLLFSNYYLIGDIGWITGLSMLTTAFCALIVLPAYLAVFEPLKKSKGRKMITKIKMKKTVVALAFLLCAPLSTPLFADPTADEIMAFNDALKEPECQSDVTTMILIDSKGKQKTRKMEMYSLKTEQGENTFIEFILPADVRGTKFLTLGNNEGDDDQRLFLPALKRVRKISSSNREGKFMGSDITYYDMESRSIDDFTYRLLGEEEVGGKACWMIESTPIDSDSPYGKVISYISKEDYFSYKREMFDTGGEHIKTLTVVETSLIDGIIVPVKSVFENWEEDHKTLLAVEEIAFDNDLDESIFTIQNLK